MPELEENIAAWRARVNAALPEQEETVRELEEHLREDIETLRRAGMGAEEAFARSVERLGDPTAVAREFGRMGARWLPASRPVLVMLSLVSAVIVTILTLLAWQYHAGKINLLLATHVFTIGSGYLVVCGTGLVGACALVTGWRRSLSARERRELRQLMLRLTLASAVLVSIGMVLGMFWAAENLGRAWSWSPVELGALLVCGSSILSLLAQTCGRLSDRIIVYLTTLGLFVVQYGWYGVNALTPVVPIMWLCLAIFLSQAALVGLNWRREKVAR